MLQDSTAVPPGVIPSGVTVKYRTVGGPGGGMISVVEVPATVTVTFAELVPAALIAVSVYVVVIAGITVLVPFVATDPTPRSIITAVAPETFQLRTTCPPSLTDTGLAVNKVIAGKPGDPAMHDDTKADISEIQIIKNTGYTFFIAQFFSKSTSFAGKCVNF